MSTLPYITAPGNIEKALKGIRAASTPERVSQDFVKTILKISGGSGSQVTSFLKKIGFADSDGTPTSIYKKFRNSATSGTAGFEALKIGYAPLYKRNEYMHQLSDDELKGLVIEETGSAEDSNVPQLVVAAITALKGFADFEAEEPSDQTVERLTLQVPETNSQLPPQQHQDSGVGLNLSYTINLNLPATSDIAVFNAIFKSLRENLLKQQND